MKKEIRGEHPKVQSWGLGIIIFIVVIITIVSININSSKEEYKQCVNNCVSDNEQCISYSGIDDYGFSLEEVGAEIELCSSELSSCVDMCDR